ncbi:MAG: hypothetical protein Q9218_004417 [Villophora microphyllina]
MNAMSVMPSITTPNDMRKPTERHMEQKYRSPWQSLACGKYSQVWVREEQRRWRPVIAQAVELGQSSEAMTQQWARSYQPGRPPAPQRTHCVESLWVGLGGPLGG